jgi:hypothetical protein
VFYVCVHVMCTCVNVSPRYAAYLICIYGQCASVCVSTLFDGCLHPWWEHSMSRHILHVLLYCCVHSARVGAHKACLCAFAHNSMNYLQKWWLHFWGVFNLFSYCIFNKFRFQLNVSIVGTKCMLEMMTYLELFVNMTVILKQL